IGTERTGGRRDHVLALTASEMEGRGSGTPGGDRAARYIAAELARAGLRPGGDAGTFFQEFVVGETPRVGPGSRLAPAAAGSRELPIGQAWTPHGGSATGPVSAELVFVGHDEYSSVSVGGRIALTLAGAPGSAARPSRLEQLIAARRAGARALLIVEDTLPAVIATAAPVALLSGSVTRAGADALLAGSGTSLAGLTRRSPGTPAAFATGLRVDLHVDLAREQVRAANVIGVLPGADPARAAEAVVIGAHYDHLGRDGAAVYHGADDNASGTAVVLGLARSLAETRPPRTLVFVLFAGEEMGLLGSAHHVRQPSAVPVERMAAMLNFDMVGRLDGRRVLVGGVDTGAGFRPLVEAAGRDAGLDLDLRGAGAGPSDHTRFHGAGVPVLFFHSGTHADYHRPSDTAEKIDIAGMARIASLGARVATRIAEGPRPVFARGPAPAPRAARRGPAGRAGADAGGAFLGIAADARAGWDGVRLGSIVPGSAAEQAGLRAGDVLVRLGDRGLHGFPDLREELGRRRPGETLALVYLRDGRDHTGPVTLGAWP
ncbi:MAG: M28 family peptidase, partial [Candidatus Rokuibacteriota bacterium]